MAGSSFLSIIELYFQRNGGWKRLKGELSVYFWSRIAGNELAKKTEAVRFQSGYLYLQTDSPALAHQIFLMTTDILRKYHKLLGPGIVKGIKIKVGAIKKKYQDSAPIIDKFKLDENEKAKIEEYCKEINDPELAERFKKLIKCSILQYKQKEINGGHQCLSCGVIIDKEFNYCPCCQQKVSEEVNAFLAYKKKNNQEVSNVDDINELNHLKINSFFNKR